MHIECAHCGSACNLLYIVRERCDHKLRDPRGMKQSIEEVKKINDTPYFCDCRVWNLAEPVAVRARLSGRSARLHVHAVHASLPAHADCRTWIAVPPCRKHANEILRGGEAFNRFDEINEGRRIVIERLW